MKTQTGSVQVFGRTRTTHTTRSKDGGWKDPEASACELLKPRIVLYRLIGVTRGERASTATIWRQRARSPARIAYAGGFLYNRPLGARKYLSGTLHSGYKRKYALLTS